MKNIADVGPPQVKRVDFGESAGICLLDRVQRKSLDFAGELLDGNCVGHGGW